MKHISSLDLLMFIIVAVYLSDMDFKNMSTLKWIGFISSSLWIVIFIVKLTIQTKKVIK